MVNIDYLYNPDAVKPIFAKDYFIDNKLGFSVIENGIILPHKDIIVDGKWTWGKGGIVDANGEYIKSSHVRESFGGGYTPSPKDIKRSSETVIYLGLFYPVWGHAITDNIRRLWFLNSDIFNSEFKNCSLVYVPWQTSPLDKQQNFKRLLEILEVNFDKLRPIEQPTQFEKIILPDGSFSSCFTEEYRETIERVRNFALKNRTMTSNKKIYYFYGKHQFGEEKLANYFKSKGYEIVRPEELPLDEQLNILINADNFASTLGSCAHNSVFLRNGTEVLLIPRRSGYFAFVQPRIDQVHPLNVNYVDSTLSIFSVDTPRANCFIISEQLKRFFGDKFDGYENDDFNAFLQYVKKSISNGLNAKPNQITGYGTVLQDFMEQLKQREELIAACDMPPGWETFRPLLTYQTHVDKDGWGLWSSENQISNPLDQKRDIQAIKINFPNHKVYYSVYYNETEGWSKEVEAPETAGTVGKRKSIFGLRIQLDEAGSKDFDVLYRVHKFDDRWTDWAKNGEVLYSYGVKLNAIQMKLEPKLTTTKA